MSISPIRFTNAPAIFDFSSWENGQMVPIGGAWCYPAAEAWVFEENLNCDVNQAQIYADLCMSPLSNNIWNRPTWKQICEASVEVLDTVNLSYAISIFAKKCLKVESKKKSIIKAHRHVLDKIQSRLVLNIKQCTAWDLASICESLVVLQINNKELFDRISIETCKKIHDYRPVDLILTANAFDVFDILDIELFDALEQETYNKSSKFNPSELCSITSLFSKYKGSERVLERLGKEAEWQISKFSPGDLAAFSATYAQADMLSKQLFFKIRDQAFIKLKEFEVNQLIPLIRSWNRLQIPINPFFLKAISEKLCSAKLYNLRRRLNDLSIVIRIFAGEKFKDPNLFKTLGKAIDGCGT